MADKIPQRPSTAPSPYDQLVKTPNAKPTTDKKRWRLHKPQLSWRLHRPSRKILLIIGVVVAILLVAGTAYAYTGYHRYHNAQADLQKATAGDFTAALSVTGTPYLSALEGRISGSGTFQKAGLGTDIVGVNQPPPTSTAVAMNFAGSLGGQNYSGQWIMNGSRLYMKLNSDYEPVLRYRQSVFTYQLTPDWTTTDLGRNFYDNLCDTGTGAHAPDWLKIYQLTRGVKNRPSWLYNPWDTLDNQAATHYHGGLDTRSVISWLNQLGRQGPHGCSLGTIGIGADDLKSVKIGYDLWTADGRDKLMLHIDNRDPALHINLAVTLYNFDLGQTITLPANVIDLDAIRAGQNALLNRDATRRNDVDRIHDALAAYARAHNGRYPASLTALVPTYLATMPRDPKTSQPYQYQLEAGGSDYTLTAKLEAPNAPDYIRTASN